jgi:nucleoside recognition membrane protein YjiH
MNTKYKEDIIIITIVYQDWPEDNKRHSNLISVIGYISFLIYCTVLRTCVLSEKSSISFWHVVYAFYMKVLKTIR